MKTIPFLPLLLPPVAPQSSPQQPLSFENPQYPEAQSLNYAIETHSVPMNTQRLLVLAQFVLFLVTTPCAQAQGSLAWTSGPDLPSPRAEAAALIAPGNTVLLMGGVSPSGAKVVPKLADEASSWTTAHDLDITRYGLGAVNYSGTGSGILAFGGGDGGNEPTEEGLFYDYYLGDSQDAEKMSALRENFAFTRA